MLMADTSFVSAHLPTQRSKANHVVNICIPSRRKASRRALRTVRMESQRETSVTPDTAEAIILDIWNKCENAKFASWLPYFDDSAVYYDTLYHNPFVGKSAIAQHLKNMESAMPPRIVFVLDDIAAGSNRVGARWHAETEDGSRIPFTRGASMYSFICRDGQLFINEAWDFPETPIKLAGIILPLLRGASTLLKMLNKQGGSTKNMEPSE